MYKQFKYFFFLYISIYAANGVLMPYSSLLFKSAGFNEVIIGILASIGPAVSLICQPLWGIASDRALSKRNVLKITLFLTSATIWFLLISKGLWGMACALVIFYIFQCAVLPLADTITLESLEGTSFKFSPIRTAGSIGYAILSALAGKALGGDISYFFLFYSVPIFIGFLVSFKLPDIEGHQQGKERFFIREFLMDKELLKVYLFAFVLQATSGYNYAFLSVYLEELNIDMSLVGIGFLVASFSQYPFLFFADSLLEKVGIENVLIVSGFFHSLRWLFTFTSMSNSTLLFIQALHGMTYIVLYYSLAQFVNKRARKELKATGQMLNWALLNGLSRILGGSLGGVFAGCFGIGRVYLFIGILAFIATLSYMFSIMRSKRARTLPQNERTTSGI